MRRRNFIKALAGAFIAGPSLAKVGGMATQAAPAAPAVLPVASGGCRMDIRDLLTQNMLKDIQEHEDRLFLEYIEDGNLLLDEICPDQGH